MSKRYRIIIPVYDEKYSPLLPLLAQALIADRRGEILLVGVVVVPEGHNLSEGALDAKARRRVLTVVKRRYADLPIRVKPRVRVGHAPWQQLIKTVKNERIDMMLIAWDGDVSSQVLGVPLEEILTDSPCDIAFVRGAEWQGAKRILLPTRGGPHADLAVRVALSLAEANGGIVSVLHAAPPDEIDSGAQAFLPMLRYLPRTQSINIKGDAVSSIIKQSESHDLIVKSTSSRADSAASRPLDEITMQIASRTSTAFIMVKSRSAPAVSAESDHVYRARGLSILTDRWFAENTFDADEFANLSRLEEIKRERKLTISLALPALNEEETVGNVIRTLQRALMDEVPLVDEIVLIDSGSQDRTREIAQRQGVPVYVHQEILPQYGAYEGKGEALWKSLYVLKGDLIVWIDTDIVNIHPRFVYGILGPLLRHDRIQYVKGFYRRPIRVGDKLQAGGGGRVTELVARPMFNLFFPELSGLIQPLSGEYAGRRSALEHIPFFSGYGVETGMLIDILNEFGLRAIAQSNLLERIHHNQPLTALSKMSFAIIQVIIRRLEDRHKLKMLDEINTSMKLITHRANRYFLDIEEIGDVERPAMDTLPEYIAAHKQDTGAAVNP